MGVAGDEADPAESAGDEVGEERVPGGPGLAGRDAEAEDFAVSVSVDAGRDEHDRVDHPAALTDLHREGVGGDESERPRITQGAMPELVDVLVEVRGHPRHLRFREGVDPEGLHELVHPAGRDAGEIAVRNDSDQRGLGPFPALEEPLREVRPLTELRDRDVDRPDTGVEVTVAVAIALRGALGAGLSPFRAHDGVRVSGKERVDRCLQQAAHQIRRRVGQGFSKHARRVDNMKCGHRDDAFRVEVRDFSKDHTVTALTSCDEPATAGYTTLRGTTHRYGDSVRCLLGFCTRTRGRAAPSGRRSVLARPPLGKGDGANLREWPRRHGRAGGGLWSDGSPSTRGADGAR